MCGICGIISFSVPIEPNTIKHMASVLTHRGPDEEGYFFNHLEVLAPNKLFAALGHRRLKIIDLTEAARQPLSNENGSIWLVYNGELYNFIALREELEAKGHIFKSKSDSEVIVHCYEEYRERCLERLDGMFAFAIWDSNNERLFLGRDRVGKKPLYYYFDNRNFIFGSEIKSILESKLVEKEIYIEGIPLYFTFGYIPSPKTFYNRIFQLPPASYLTVNKKGIQGPFSYWDMEYPAEGRELQISEEEACMEIRRLLKEAVKKRLVSDVPLGAFLSGGIDSSIVVGLMSEIMGTPVKTFSIGFTGNESYDETRYANLVAEHFKTDHTEFMVQPNAFDLVEKLLSYHDEPYGDSSAIPTYLVSELTKVHVTVALGGDGGDEIFAGYERFLAAFLAERIPKLALRIFSKFTTLIPQSDNYHSLGRRLERFFEYAKEPLFDRYLSWSSIFTRDLIAKLIIKNDLSMLLDKTKFIRYLNQYYEIVKNCNSINQLLYLNFKTYLPDDLLIKMDRMSMANSLEIRSPFLDKELTEYVAKLPMNFKIKRGKLKYILKKSFSDFLPKPILKRKKHGFGVPLGTWFRGELKGYVKDVLFSTSARYSDYLNRKFIEKIYYEHQSGKRDYGHQLWTLLNFELWLRKL
jgi:asparagine synthase (glutamine-hydrolysing)